MSRNNSRFNRLRLFAGVLATTLSISAFAQSVQFPKYKVGAQTNGTFIASDGTVLNPAGIQVNLGIRVRAKAVAVNPTGNHTAAVLNMGTSRSNGNAAVEVFNTQTGAVLQNYSFNNTDAGGSSTGITYSPDGKFLLFSQDGDYGPSGFVTIASVNPTTGLLTDSAQVSVPLDATTVSVAGIQLPLLKNANCTQTVTMPVTNFKMSAPVGTTGSLAIPCGIPVSAASDGTTTSYPTGVAVSPGGTTAYAVLNFNDTLAKIDLTKTPPVEVTDIRVGNVPHSVVISPNGTTAYVSNEAGRIATKNDFQLYSNGTPVVAVNPTGATASGTISVVDLSTFTVTGSITTGLHPTGMAFWGSDLLVANAYDDTISDIDTQLGAAVRTISLGLPISVPGSATPAYGAGPNSIAVDNIHNIAYVALYNANAIAVVNLEFNANPAVEGLIPVGYAPSGVALDSADGVLIVANDKGWGTTGNPSTCNAPGPSNPTIGTTVSGAPTTSNSCVKEFGAIALETHQDLGTVSIVPLPSAKTLAAWTKQVTLNNHWDLSANIAAAAGGSSSTAPVAIPAHIGDPSLIKHVFLIIRENRTYDQILGDVVGGNGDPSLAVFGDDNAVTGQMGPVTPNVHTLLERFPLLDNFYDPSRQSADGHNWILQAMAPYSDDIQSPDWLRDYPSNGGDALAYQNKGHLFDVAAAAGVSQKIYGEYIEENTFNPPGCKPSIITSSCEPSWSEFYQDTVDYEGGVEPQLYFYNTIGSYTPLPILMKYAVQNYPQFDLGIPDQYRVDVWKQDFANDVKNGTVPQLEMMWISSDHTGGQPTAQAMQADNDLAVGRFVDIISHSSIWSSSAIFIEEDDAQTGVDHVDGHRSPGYIISPYVQQKVNSNGTGAGVNEKSNYISQVNFTRTIEQILGLTPMNQNDLVASPLYDLFINNPPANNFLPWTHVPNGIPLDLGVTPIEAYNHDSPAVKALRAGWMKKKTEIFAGKYHVPDSEDSDTVNHLNWYESTGFTRPYPGEKKVRPASEFNKTAPAKADNDDI
jgi:DNA-binding beta-propeller fold protein YncE